MELPQRAVLPNYARLPVERGPAVVRGRRDLAPVGCHLSTRLSGALAAAIVFLRRPGSSSTPRLHGRSFWPCAHRCPVPEQSSRLWRNQGSHTASGLSAPHGRSATPFAYARLDQPRRFRACVSGRPRWLTSLHRVAGSTPGLTTLIGLPRAYATTWSKMSENCSSYSSRVT